MQTYIHAHAGNITNTPARVRVLGQGSAVVTIGDGQTDGITTIHFQSLAAVRAFGESIVNQCRARNPFEANEMCAEAVARAKTAITLDVLTGIIPVGGISTFGDLHDYVDANEYGGLCESEYREALDEYGDRIQNAVGDWISDDDWMCGVRVRFRVAHDNLPFDVPKGTMGTVVEIADDLVAVRTDGGEVIPFDGPGADNGAVIRRTLEILP